MSTTVALRQTVACDACGEHETVVRNLTPHDVTIIDTDGHATVISPDGRVPRVVDHAVRAGEVAGVALYETTAGEVEGLPSDEPGTYWVVSARVAQACPGRADLLVPHGLVRDAAGRVIGCQGLARLAPPPPAEVEPAPALGDQLARVLTRLANIDARLDHAPAAVWPEALRSERAALVWQAAGLAAQLGFQVGIDPDPSDPVRPWVLAVVLPTGRVGWHVDRGAAWDGADRHVTRDRMWDYRP